MEPDRTPLRSRPWLLGLLLALALGAAPLHAQDPKLLLAGSAEEIDAAREGDMLLRPNTRRTFHVVVHNPGNDERTVTVALRQPGARSPVLQSKPLVLKGGAKEPVVWDVPAVAAPAAPAPATPAPAPAPAALELKHPNRSCEVVLLDGKKELGQAVVVKLLQPKEYLNITESKAAFDGGKGKLTATILANDEFTGPPAPVRLVLDPTRIPDLVVTEELDGTYQRALTEKGRTVKLTANNLTFRQQSENTLGLVTVDVDGFGRALTWRMTFNPKSSDSQGQPIKDYPLVRVKADRFWKAGPKYPVTLLIDNADRNLKVEVGIDRNGDGQYDDDEIQVWPTARKESVVVQPGPDGALAFTTAVQDWKLDLDVANLYGSVTLRVRLLDDKGAEVKLLDEAAALALNPVPQPAAYESVLFDSSGPGIEALGVVGFPAEKGKPNQLLRGKPLTLYARADDKTGIKEVAFFIGKPTAEGAPPPGVELVPGNLVPKDAKAASKAPTWLAQLPVPTDKPGRVPVGVQVTNGAGIKSFGTVVIELVDAPKADAKPRSPAGNIEGTVTENNRVQPNVTVVLRDAQNTIRDSVKTDARGKFAFKDIPPGTYRLQASKSTSSTEGSTSVQVQDGQTKSGVDISLKRP